MSAANVKKNKKRKNKAKSNAGSIPSVSPEHSANLLEKLMDAGDDPLDFPRKCNHSVNSCFLCHREKDDSLSADDNWEDLCLSSIEISEHLPLWLCSKCENKIKVVDEALVKEHISSLNVCENLSVSSETESIYDCQICYLRKFPHCECNSSQIEDSCADLILFIKHLYKHSPTDWTEEKNPYEVILLEKLKHMVKKLSVDNAHDLFLWVEFQVRDCILELRSALLELRCSGISREQAKMFMIELMESYDKICIACQRLKPCIEDMENEYLKKLNLTWELVNKRLFQSIIYSYEHIQTFLPIIIQKLYSCENNEEDQKEISSIFYKYDEFDKQMRHISRQYSDPHFGSIEQELFSAKNKLTSPHDLNDILTLHEKVEHQILAKCDPSFNKSPCDDCTLKYLLTCKLLPHPESKATSHPSFTPSFASMFPGLDICSETSQSITEDLSPSAFEIPNSIKKALGEDVKKLTQIMNNAVNTSSSGYHSVTCNTLSSQCELLDKREPGDGASDNCNSHHNLLTKYCMENIKGQYHTCSNNASNSSVDSSNCSPELVASKPCECHQCVKDADRATIPSIISSPTPQALCLYPHIHGVNSDHTDINSHPLLKHGINSHFTHLTTTSKVQRKENNAAASNGKAKDNSNVDSWCPSKLSCAPKLDKTNQLSMKTKAPDVVESTKTNKQTSVKIQTQELINNDDAQYPKCVNKAVQATSSPLTCPSSVSGVSHMTLDHSRVKHLVHTHTSTSSGSQKNTADVSCCINEYRHNSSKSANIRPHIADDNGSSTTVIHSCTHQGGHTHASTTIKHICRETRCSSIRESHSLSPSRSCSDVDQLRSGDGEDCVDDTCSEQSSSTSTSNTKDAKHCDCCYCEVFGHDVEKPTSNRNFAEYRDKLKKRLEKRPPCKIKRASPSPPEDERSLESLIDFINGEKELNTQSENSPKKLVKKPKKSKKPDAKRETKVDSANEEELSSGSSTSKANCVKLNVNSSIENLEKKVKKLDGNMEKLNIIKKLSKETENKKPSFKEKKDDNSQNLKALKEVIESFKSSMKDEDKVLHFSQMCRDKKEKSDPQKNDKKVSKNLVMDTTKAKVDKQNAAADISKLRKQLPYSNADNNNIAETLASKPIANSNNRSPSPIVNGTQTQPTTKEKSLSSNNKLCNGVSVKDSTQKRYRQSKDKAKSESASVEKSQLPSSSSSCSSSSSSSLISDQLPTKLNGIRQPTSIPNSSPSLINQSTLKGRKKNKLANPSPASIDEVFMPSDIDLDNVELDETERELEAFKRFCYNSVPVPDNQKIRVNFSLAQKGYNRV